MKRVTRVCIIGGGNICYKLFEMFKGAIPKEYSKYQYKGGQLNLFLEPDSEELYQLIELTKQYNLHPTLFSEVYYTKNEIEKCTYFQMNILSPLEREGTKAADYGTQYEGGCINPDCIIGKKLIGDALVDSKLMKKWDIGFLRPDIYVSEKLKNIITLNNLTGVSFEHEVIDYKGRDMPKYYVMNIHNVLLPMSSSTWLYPVHRQNYCEPIQYLRSDVHYEKEKLKESLDFNLSMEYVDNFQERVIVVSDKVRKLFSEYKIHAGFIPINVI